MVESYGLLGDGAQADETEEFALPDHLMFRAVSSGFLIDGRRDLVDIVTEDRRYTGLPVIAAVGAPGTRKQLIETWAGSLYKTVVARSSWVSASAHIGEGSIVAPQSIVSTHATIGRHTLLNIGSSVSHDCVIGDFVTVSPGVRVAGKCRIGDGVFLGIGSTVSDGVSIVAGSVIGAGAVVIDDIESPGVYVGVPAKRLRDQEGWLRAI